MTDRETVDVYNSKADEYDQLEVSESASETLATFIAALPDNGRVLDLGCGPGTSSQHMANAGLRVDATDASPEMVALASRIDGINTRVATFDDLSEVSEYDGVWANFSLLHAPLADIPRHFGAIHRALKPGGLFHIGVKEGTGEKRDPLGRKYTYFTVPVMNELLRSHGFTPGPITRGRDKGLDGVVAPWFSLTSHA